MAKTLQVKLLKFSEIKHHLGWAFAKSADDTASILSGYHSGTGSVTAMHRNRSEKYKIQRVAKDSAITTFQSSPDEILKAYMDSAFQPEEPICPMLKINDSEQSSWSVSNTVYIDCCAIVIGMIDLMLHGELDIELFLDKYKNNPKLNSYPESVAALETFSVLSGNYSELIENQYTGITYWPTIFSDEEHNSVQKKHTLIFEMIERIIHSK